ncbi:MAG: NAD(P)/FAD-dependent oxidoreductase [Anaerolineae bacterium]|nr:NAD(P)/FAD-dependent oxidoreductase [Anaerolineae bacterium]MCO5205335.1 NAD(P)/FAD-dependent oxidoreductase [Anaerolineae bacterium]
MTDFDAIVIGAGHNSLTAAAYLAQAGYRVLVVERRAATGGTATTAMFHPGYSADTVQHDAGLLRQRIIDDLQLTQYGLALTFPDPIVFAPTQDGQHLAIWEDEVRTTQAIGRFSAHDAANYPAYRAAMTNWSAYLEAQLAQPPNMDLLRQRDMMLLIRQCSMSAERFLSQWFTHPFVQGVLAAPAITGICQGPYSGGTAYNLLHHHLGQRRAGSVATAQVQGGIGRLADALQQAAQAHGTEIRLNGHVDQITVVNNRVTGVRLRDGTQISAETVLSGADPQATFIGMLDPFDLPPRFKKAVRHIKMRGAVAKLNLALRGLPTVIAAPNGNTDYLRGRIQISPSLTYLERAYDAAKYGEFSAEPYLDIRIPTIADPTLAPQGHHVMSIWMQYAPYKLRHGTWATQRHALAETILNTITHYMPDIRDLIVAQQLLMPSDLASDFGLTEGALYHGELMLDQLLYMRPVAGWSNYATPIEGLYVCGAGAHPGGGITGEPGRLAAAQRISHDIIPVHA